MSESISDRVKGLFLNAPHGAQQKFAEFSGFGRTAINNMIIRENTKVPSEMIVPLSKYFGVSVEWILTGEETAPALTPVPLMKIDSTLVELLCKLDREDQIELRGYVRHMVEMKNINGKKPKDITITA